MPIGRTPTGPIGPTTPATRTPDVIARESLNLALPKLRSIIASLPAGGPERKRAEHTLKSVEGAFTGSGTHGAPPGKYAVKIEGYPGNRTAPYTQNEGMPVDELIDILQHSTDPDTQALGQKLLDNSETYFEAHYTGAHGTDPTVWTQAKKDKQDLRTRYEAKLISKDYRSTGGEEEDYRLAMEVLKNRRELKFVSAPPPPPPPPVETPLMSAEDLAALERSRDLYLNAKRKRGNVVRGKVAGALFGRKLFRDGEKKTLAGKKGAEDLETIRKDYEARLQKYNEIEIKRFQEGMYARLGSFTEAEFDAEIRVKMIELAHREQGVIDVKATTGIEKNICEKMKTKWRQYNKTRMGVGALLTGTGITLAATGVGSALVLGGVVGAKGVMGTVGTYVGTEALLERNKWIGHKGLINDINKANFITDESLYRHIRALSPEDVKKEAARLRMLQVEKGLSMDKMDTDRKIASMIISRDIELTVDTTMSAANADRTGVFADKLSENFATQIDAGNACVESEVDRERKHKMARKITAMVAAGFTGWLVGQKLSALHGGDNLPTPPSAPIRDLPEPLKPINPTLDNGSVAGDGLPDDHSFNPELDVVRQNEGIEHVFRRQIEHDPALAEKLLYHGDFNDKVALHEFSGRAAHRLAIDQGYVDKMTGEEIRVGPADELAYKIKLENGELKVDEIRVHGGFQEQHEAGASFEGTAKENYEYRDFARHVPDHQAGATPEPAPAPTEHIETPRTEAEIAPDLNSVEEGHVVPTVYEQALQREAEIIAQARGISIEEAKAMLEESLSQTQTGEPTFDQNTAVGTARENVIRNFADNEPREVEMEPMLYGRTIGITGNPFHLEPDLLNQADKVYTNNLMKIFPDNNSAWQAVSEIKAHTVLENIDTYNSDTPIGSVSSYLHRLQKITGLNPQGGWLFGKENTGHYMARALQKVAEMGQLDEVR